MILMIDTPVSQVPPSLLIIEHTADAVKKFKAIEQSIFDATQLLADKDIPEFCALYLTTRNQLLEVSAAHRAHDLYIQEVMRGIQRQSHKDNILQDDLIRDNELLACSAIIYMLNTRLTQLLTIASVMHEDSSEVLQLMQLYKPEWIADHIEMNPEFDELLIHIISTTQSGHYTATDTECDEEDSFPPEDFTDTPEDMAAFNADMEADIAEYDESDMEDDYHLVFVLEEANLIKVSARNFIGKDYPMLSYALSTLAEYSKDSVPATVVAIKEVVRGERKIVQIFNLDCSPSDIPSLAASYVMYNPELDCFECDITVPIDLLGREGFSAAIEMSPQVGLFTLLASIVEYLYIVDLDALYRNDHLQLLSAQSERANYMSLEADDLLPETD